MSLTIACGGCKKKLRIADTLRGKVVKCPHCAKKSRVPNQTASTDPPPQVETAIQSPIPSVPSATKPAPVKASISTKPGPATAIKKAASTAGANKKPASQPLPSDDEAFSEEPLSPPPPPPKPVPSAPRKASSRKRNDDDDERTGPNKLIIFGGGAFIAVALLGFAFWYLFLTEPSLGRVEGVLTLDDQPVDGATMVFINDKDPKLGRFQSGSGAGGSFRIAAEVPPGKYKVAVEQIVLPDGKKPGSEIDQNDYRERGLLKNKLPETYANPHSTPLTIEVRSGSQTIPIKLKSSGQP